jgi:hypothetical protein
MLKRRSVLFNPVRRLNHVFSLIAVTLGTCKPLYTLAIQYAASRTCQVRIVAALYTATTDGICYSNSWRDIKT